MILKGYLLIFLPTFLTEDGNLYYLKGKLEEEMLKKDKIQELISPWIESDGYQIIRAAVYRFHSLLTDKFRHGNCFLIGDAAHQNPPFMGQGMMSGYRDALNLSWKLTAVIQKHTF